jgi:hypothetical protein
MPQNKDVYREFNIFRKLLQDKTPGVGRNPEEVDKALTRFLGKLEKHTLSTLPPSKSYWQHHLFACANIAGSFGSFADDKRKLSSVMNIRMLEVLRLLIEYRILERACAYYSICRQLRFMLESMLQAYYVDAEYSELDLQGKISVLKQMKKDKRSIGRPLLDMISIDKRIELWSMKKRVNITGRIENLYKELSDSVHPDYSDFLPFLTESGDHFEWISRFMLVPNPKLSDYCSEKLNQVMDMIYLLVFDNFQGYAFVPLKWTEDVLSDTKCFLTLSYIDSKRKKDANTKK